MTCKNCDAQVSGQFCSACGQTAHVHRITIGHLVHEFTHALTHADKGFLLLLKTLLRYPGIVAREYVEGKRKKYFNPVSFLVITAAACALITYKAGYFEALTASQGGTPSRGKIPYWNETMQISTEHGKLLGLILITPIYTLLAWLFFWRPRFNIAEHFVLQSYTIGFQYVVTALVFVPLFLLFPSTVKINNNVLHLLYIVYLGVAYKQFLQKKHMVFTTLKSLLMFPLFVILFWGSIWLYVAAKHLIVGS